MKVFIFFLLAEISICADSCSRIDLLEDEDPDAEVRFVLLRGCHLLENNHTGKSFEL